MPFEATTRMAIVDFACSVVGCPYGSPQNFCGDRILSENFVREKGKSTWTLGPDG
jgi:hypothetical protein